MRVRIPRSVDRAWDRAERHGRALGAVVLLLVAGAGALWLPALGALAVGILLGAAAALWRTARRLAALRADNDELLRENGALHHRVAALERGIREHGSVETQVLPFIPSEDD
ncbi:hypothetical protein LO762_10240 [Actinocorallia sp. API 0066]|uniref:hypothetical protein n=1 Tax=Actinocorallia sp. API 0066 TaxID=2896846 RepID=UPI001E529D17|nr:hypothetical protein [Actinocorallia sp. API 0066]MCD0449568.1 hypothetical protein [Actinocorallia sp. API 0066]